MRCKICGNIESKPAAWDGLADAIKATEGMGISEAIAVQLEYSQPSGEVYAFLTRTLELATKFNADIKRCSRDYESERESHTIFSCWSAKLIKLLKLNKKENIK